MFDFDLILVLTKSLLNRILSLSSDLRLLEIRVTSHRGCLVDTEGEKKIIDDENKNCPEGFHVKTSCFPGLTDRQKRWENVSRLEQSNIETSHSKEDIN